MSETVLSVTGLIIAVIGALICFFAKIILNKFRVTKTLTGEDAEENMPDMNVLRLKLIGFAVAAVGGLIVFCNK